MKRQEAGVYGESREAEGVRGVGHNGAGVSGTSEEWVGVHGKGKHLAGFFEGNVNVSQNLIVNEGLFVRGAALDITGLLKRLEQLELAVAMLTNQPLPARSPRSYTISVSTMGSQFILTGTGFYPSKDSYVHVVYPDFSRRFFTQTTDPSGNLNFAIETSSLCVFPGLSLTFIVNQADSLGYDQWSNEAKTSCP